MDRLVNCRRLKQARLWAGSDLETDFQYGGVSLSRVVQKRDALAADIRAFPNEATAGMREMLEALEYTIQNPGG